MSDAAQGRMAKGENHLAGHLREYGMLMALLAIVLFFVIVVRVSIGVDFLSAQNITNIFLQNSYVVIMALGMLLVILLGMVLGVVLMVLGVALLVQELYRRPTRAEEGGGGRKEGGGRGGGSFPDTKL